MRDYDEVRLMWLLRKAAVVLFLYFGAKVERIGVCGFPQLLFGGRKLIFAGCTGCCCTRFPGKTEAARHRAA